MWFTPVGGLVTLILSLLAAPLAAEAQPAAKIPTVGVLMHMTPLELAPLSQMALTDLAIVSTVAGDPRAGRRVLGQLKDESARRYISPVLPAPGGCGRAA